MHDDEPVSSARGHLAPCRAQGRTATLAGLVVLLSLMLLTSCESAPTYRESADSIGQRLVDQMSRRVDLRSVRLYIADLEPLGGAVGEASSGMKPSMVARHEISSQRLRQEIMAILAPLVNVLESDASDEASLPDPDEGPRDVFAEASARGATAVLLGNYVMEDGAVLVMLRVVDVSEMTVLAAAQGTVPHAPGIDVHDEDDME